MRKKLILIVLLVIFLIGGNGYDLARLTVINKSGMEVHVRLTTKNRSRTYYLRTPIGDRTYPSETTFTIVRDTYRMQVYHIQVEEGYKPINPHLCGRSRSGTLEMIRNTRLTVIECDRIPVSPVEPGFIKVGLRVLIMRFRPVPYRF